MKIGFKKLHPDAIIPKFGHDDPTNMGIDFYARPDFDSFFLLGNTSIVIPTGIAWQPSEIPEGWKAGLIIKSRSGMAINSGIECSNAGVIDQGYTGEIMIKLYNNTPKAIQIDKGARIAQGIPFLVPDVIVEEIQELEETERGNKGFGSSGDK